MRVRIIARLALGTALLITIWNCADDDSSAGSWASKKDGGSVMLDAGGTSKQCYGANDCPPGYYCNEFYTCAPMKPPDQGIPVGDGSRATPPDAALPPELENRAEAPPAVGKRYMYVAVAKQNRVVKIDSVSLQVRAIKVGQDPGALRTITGQDVAVVLNRKSSTATVIRNRADGKDDLTTLKTAPDLNNMAISPDGTYAVAFFDLTLSKGAISASQNLQDVSLITLEKGKEKAVTLTVGFKPSEVLFSKDSSRAFVVAEKVVSIIDPAKATKSAIMPTVPMLTDPIKEPKPAEVLVTPDGKLALLRQKGVNKVRAVDLATKAITDLTLTGEPTDLDLTKNGKVAVAVLRDTSEVVVIDVPGDLNASPQLDTISVGKYTAGQSELTSDGKYAFLFTNAVSQEVLLMADLTARKLKVHQLQKGVRQVLAAPDGKTALVKHNKVYGTPSKQDSLETYIDKSHGFSLFSLGLGFAKLQLTGTDPGKVAFAPDSSAAYMLLNDTSKGIRSVEAMDLSSFLIQSVTMGSPPVSLGVIASTKKVYVAQDHALGRVTFVDMTTNKTQTVTGFELNSQVIE